MSRTETWSPERVAVMLHGSLDQVMEAIRRGNLQAKRVGEQFVITHEQLAAFTQHGNPFARRRDGPTDEELMALAQGGDNAAFYELDARYWRKIWVICYSIIGDWHEAEDLTQETLIKVFRNLDKFDRSRPLRPWIMRIALNTCRDLLKSKGWKVRQGQVSLEEPLHDQKDEEMTLEDILPSLSSDPQQQVEMAELWRAVKECLMELNPRERLAIWARFFDEQTYREMMSELNVTSERGAQYVIDQAVKKLRDCLRSKGYEAI